MRTTHFYLPLFCVIPACMAVVYAVLYLWFIWPSGTCTYRDQGVIINLLLELECILESLIARHEVFRINYAGWLFVLMMPGVVFLTTPYTNSRKRMAIILTAILCGYVLLNISIAHDRAVGWHIYNQCQSQFSDGSIQQHEECRLLLHVPTGAANVFSLFFGWTISMTYAGLWEVVWRLYYRRTIRRMDNRFKGRWFSNLLIAGIFAPWIAPWVILSLI